jgi:hypothetical protein
MDLLGGQTQMLNIWHIRGMNCHPIDTDEDCAPQSISDTDYWLNWNGNQDNPNDSDGDYAVDVESGMEQDNIIENPECPEQQVVSAAPNVPRLIRPAWKSRWQAETVMATVNEHKTRWNKAVKTQSDRIHQYFTFFFMYLD